MYPNPFESEGFAGFWSRVEQEWAEAEKRLLYYPFECLGLDCDECVTKCDAYYDQLEEEEAEQAAEEELLEETGDDQGSSFWEERERNEEELQRDF